MFVQNTWRGRDRLGPVVLPLGVIHPIHGLALALAITVLLFADTGASAETTLEDLGPAPAFTLESHDGDRFDLAGYLEKGPVIIDFWATWCKPCRRAMPHLQALYEKYRQRGVTVIGISEDDPRSQAKIGSFLRSQQITFPVLLDGEKQVARQYRVATLPTTFLISSDGQIVSLHRGYRDGDEKLLEQQLEALLAVSGQEVSEP
ncbi:MAG: TlpA disulfide reductase family protein [bacterium]